MNTYVCLGLQPIFVTMNGKNWKLASFECPIEVQTNKECKTSKHFQNDSSFEFWNAKVLLKISNIVFFSSTFLVFPSLWIVT